METLKDEVISQFRAIMDEETSVVVVCLNGDATFSAIKTTGERAGLLTDLTGRQDPETFILRAILDETGDGIRTAKTITVSGEQANIENCDPDSVGAIVKLTCKKRRTA